MNNSLFTKFRRDIHSASRELYSIIDHPFADKDSIELAQLALQQISFLLSITEFDCVSS